MNAISHSVKNSRGALLMGEEPYRSGSPSHFPEISLQHVGGESRLSPCLSVAAMNFHISSWTFTSVSFTPFSGVAAGDFIGVCLLWGVPPFLALSSPERVHPLSIFSNLAYITC